MATTMLEPQTAIAEQPAYLPTTEVEQRDSLWPGRLAATMVALVWPLIWVGGLVTTYDAGMSVPDWPGTYGYNLFLYPLSTWLLGPFDLFIEHGHRLLGALVGFVAIGFLISAMVVEHRRWVVGLAFAVLIAVIGQGVLGGLRVTMSARTLAMIHGCTGPAFFVLCVVAAAVTGRRWSKDSVLAAAGGNSQSIPTRSPSLVWPVVILGLAYTQLLLGAQLRHVSPTFSNSGFSHIVTTHVTTAFLLWLITAIAAVRTWRCGDLTLSRPATALVCFVGVQILLGVGTWIVNYGYPEILASLPGSETYHLRVKDWLAAAIVTGHVATGSLIMALAGLWIVRGWRRQFVLRESTARLAVQ